MAGTIRVRAFAWIAAAAAGFSASAAMPTSAQALTVASTVTAGVPLPAHDRSGPAYDFPTTASSQYVAWSYSDDPYNWQIPVYRVSDGAMAGFLPNGASIVGGDYVTEAPNTTYPTQVIYTSIATGAVDWSVDLPSGQTVVKAGPRWLLTATAAGEGHLLTPDGRDRVISGGLPIGDGDPIRADATGASVQNGTDVWYVDVASASAQELTTAAEQYEQLVLTATRVMWTVNAYSPYLEHVHWHDRADVSSGTVDLPGGSTLYPAGAGVVTVGQGNPLAFDVRPVDLSNGSIGSPIISSGVVVTSVDDATLVESGDTGTGRLAALTSTTAAPTTVLLLPPYSYPANGIWLSGNRVLSSYEQQGVSYVAGLVNADGTGGWTDNLDGLPVGTNPIPYEPFNFQGDVVQTAWGNTSCVLTWPGGSRTLPTDCGNTILGRGGQLIAASSVASDDLTVSDVRTGRSYGTWHLYLNTAIDADEVWTLASSTGVLTGQDVTGATASRTVSTGVTCPQVASLHVAGRWALIYCPVTGTTAVDLDGVVPLWRPPTGAGWWSLAGDVVVTQRELTSPADPIPFLYDVVDVYELAGSHREQEYGPVSRAATGHNIAFAPDASGGHALAYLDPAGEARRVDLSWVTTPPTTSPDTTGPVVDTVTGTARTAPSGTVTVSWTAHDPTSAVAPASGVASYDMRTSTSASGPWRTVSSGIQATSQPVRVTGDVAACVELRAHDNAGNLGGWSTPWCSPAWTGAPSPVVRATVPAVTGSGHAVFSFGAADATGVTGYDVQVRTAPAGKGLTGWAQPRAWADVRTGQVSASLPPGQEVCFRVRPLGTNGQHGSWAPARCTLRLVDDRQLAASRGSVRRGRWTVLAAHGRLTSAVQTGRAVVLTVRVGPGQGRLLITAAGHRIRQITLRAAHTGSRTVVITARAAFHGALILSDAGGGAVAVDGVGVLR